MHTIPRCASFVLLLSLFAFGSQARPVERPAGERPAAPAGTRPAAPAGARPEEQGGARLRLQGPAAGSPSFDYAKKVAVVGASVSAGFGLEGRAQLKREAPRDPAAPAAASLPAQRPQLARTWSDLIDDSIVVEHEVLRCASMTTFMDPEKITAEQLMKARNDGATAIVAIDGLFWFAYGQRPEDERARLFEAGLALYADLQTPLLLGDIPTMSEGLMLRASMLPTAASIAAFNARLAEWAKARPNVAIVPLAKAAAAMRAGDDVVAWGHVYPTKGGAAVLQVDQLHTTYEGNLALWSLTLDSWATLVPAGELLPFSDSPMDMQFKRNWRHGSSDPVKQYARSKDYPADGIWRGRGAARTPATGPAGEGGGARGAPDQPGAPDRRPVDRKPLERKPGG